MAVFLMASILLLSFFSVPAFAYESEDDFDISDYTWEDIMTMSNEEFHELLSNFERVYDPFGTYETNPLTVDNKSVQPYWTSGTEDMSEQGSHELITARACGLVLADKGFWGTTHNGSIVVALSISLASIIPDKNLLLGPLDLLKATFMILIQEKTFREVVTLPVRIRINFIKKRLLNTIKMDRRKSL